MRWISFPSIMLCSAAALLAASAWTPLAAQTSRTELAALEGDPVRGERYYTYEYKCYACHGYDAQTGERRLKPLNFTQDGFIIYVQNSPLPQMPAYPDMPAQALADVFAYIRSIPDDAPDIEDVPLLRDIRDRALGATD